MPKAKYGHRHQIERTRWSRRIAAQGGVECHAAVCVMPNRWIPAGSPWDLGHDTTGTIWTGPEHPRCNRREGAIRGNRKRGRRRAVRRWTL